MKQTYFLFLFIIFSVVSCTDKYTEEFMVNNPVFLSYDELRTSIKASPAKTLKNPGKIYFKDNHIFIVEELSGIHVINYENPENPQNITFIEIPGCVDIAIKNNSLYADSYIDLVVIDIADLNQIKETNRIKNVLPYTVPPTGNQYPVTDVNAENGVVVRWKAETIRREIEQVSYPINQYPHYKFGNFRSDASYSSLSSGSVSGGSSFGIGGSMARFGLYDKYLYVIDNSRCHVFNVEVAESPVNSGSQSVGWDVETMFIYDNHMFLGTMSGMLIYSLENPVAPTSVSSFWHATSCDPVVVADGYAYITLRNGVDCRASDINRLDVIKLSDDYKDNFLISSFNMTNPHGLGIDGDILFLCDGDAGLKVFDATDKVQVGNRRIAHFPNIHAYDVIPVNNILFMVGNDGFYFYDYSDVTDIKLKGKIAVK